MLPRAQTNLFLAFVGGLKWRGKLQRGCGPLRNSKPGATHKGRAGCVSAWGWRLQGVSSTSGMGVGRFWSQAGWVNWQEGMSWLTHLSVSLRVEVCPQGLGILERKRQSVEFNMKPVGTGVPATRVQVLFHSDISPPAIYWGPTKYSLALGTAIGTIELSGTSDTQATSSYFWICRRGHLPEAERGRLPSFGFSQVLQGLLLSLSSVTWGSLPELHPCNGCLVLRGGQGAPSPRVFPPVW